MAAEKQMFSKTKYKPDVYTVPEHVKKAKLNSPNRKKLTLGQKMVKLQPIQKKKLGK